MGFSVTKSASRFGGSVNTDSSRTSVRQSATAGWPRRSVVSRASDAAACRVARACAALPQRAKTLNAMPPQYSRTTPTLSGGSRRARGAGGPSSRDRFRPRAWSSLRQWGALGALGATGVDGATAATSGAAS
ncbi:hypothetical protein AURANDRAFT_63791 [Aureococcus anophagefferens]|uniref:Uncharacterized protein n=1 Tax=Aureococcus anophagefferens TaxID=44056 RepID=F0Y7T4_AURAN|nr:hypothetical protein AURANDRAFT_63791 [Aureococcus anophagefferens]EGB08491.1 hypothetical protein AURANDRAFT_63791 [Aureococcus anophagefferens]|eukprot:XP_009036504.1 hypothetical protein AURANDRAFT_63791 [Aureococcus anophagefferens]